jgi:enoyl-CoA hydratase/carnithine racemase
MNDEKSESKALVNYSREGHIGFITLDRPDKRNAMNSALWKDLDKAIGLAEEDEEARVIILRGQGKSFCAGLDLHRKCVELGGNVRTGLEDTFYKPDGEKAKNNGVLVEALAKIVREVGREIASPSEAREILGLR